MVIPQTRQSIVCKRSDRISPNDTVSNLVGVDEAIKAVGASIDEASGGLEVSMHQRILDWKLPIADEQGEQIRSNVGTIREFRIRNQIDRRVQPRAILLIVRPAGKLDESPAVESLAVRR